MCGGLRLQDDLLAGACCRGCADVLCNGLYICTAFVGLYICVAFVGLYWTSVQPLLSCTCVQPGSSPAVQPWPLSKFSSHQGLGHSSPAHTLAHLRMSSGVCEQGGACGLSRVRVIGGVQCIEGQVFTHALGQPAPGLAAPAQELVWDCYKLVCHRHSTLWATLCRLFSYSEVCMACLNKVPA
jgi:hypothetical protein